jgi:hypothetical protein
MYRQLSIVVCNKTFIILLLPPLVYVFNITLGIIYVVPNLRRYPYPRLLKNKLLSGRHLDSRFRGNDAIDVCSYYDGMFCEMIPF